MDHAPSDVIQTLQQFDQLHLLHWWDELDDVQRKDLIAQIRAVDFEVIQSVRRKAGETAGDVAVEAPSRADIAQAPSAVVHQPQSEEDKAKHARYTEIGEALLANGNVAVITVAGGQGSRLGFDHPKGMFPIGPVSDRTLFQIFAEQIQARRIRHGGAIPWLMMTSSATHVETVAFFEQHNHFGLDPQTIHFFQQGSMPAVDADTGKVLMSDKGELALSPDGHGGLVTALRKSGLLDRMANEGVQHFFYHQVDNPTVIMCDPALIGVHADRQSDLTTNVVRKVAPMEKMGVLVDMNGRLEIIEYSELNEQQAVKCDDSGQWIFWAGNTAIHVFALSFFETLTEDGCQLELHLASKKVAHLDDSGLQISPTEPNANKFERFIFDALPLAKNALIVEGDRDREFNPVKNAEGADSPATAREGLSRISRTWLAELGHSVADNQPVEISPLLALDAAELQQKLNDGVVSVTELLSTAS